MLERRLFRTIAALAFVTGVLQAGSARAQGMLGFSCDTNQGHPGDNVDCHVTPADIAAECTTNVTDLGAEFAPIFDLMNTDYDFIGMYFPDCAPPPLPSCTVFLADYTYEQEAYTVLALGAAGIAFNADFGFGGGADLALPQTFVLTFATLATQQPVGPRSLFDMTTGEGSITVPDIGFHSWALAGACVEPDIDLLTDAITAGAAYLQARGVPTSFADDGQFVLGLLDPSSDWFIVDILPDMLAPMMVPKALGFEIFNILECGNGVTEFGEQCDDGNTADGDCCSSTCQFEANGSPCADDGDACSSDVCDGAGSCTHPVDICSDVPIDGRDLRIRRSPSGSEKLVFTSGDPDVPFPVADGPNDPRTVGATLEVITQGEGTAVFEMPAGNWTANGAGTVFKFVNAEAPGGPSTVKVTQLKHGRLKILARNTGLPLVNPLVRAAARLQIGLSRTCALFEGPTVRKDEPNYFLGKKAPAPAVSDCTKASLGFSPSGAFLDPSSD